MEHNYQLNQALLDAAENCKLDDIKALLLSGADPLGSPNPDRINQHILGELFCSACDDERLSKKLPEIVLLFLEHGMDIASRIKPLDDHDDINPLWDLSFLRDENALKTLKVLLDHNLDTESVEDLIEHIFIDMEICDGSDIEDAWSYHWACIGLKMVMLTASYPHILSNSTYLMDCIDLAHNKQENLPWFRNWDNGIYEIDKSTCTNLPHGLREATLRIKDKNTNEIMWSLII